MLVIEKDKDKMRNYHRCKDMINLIDYFPELSPIVDLTIVKDYKDYLDNYDVTSKLLCTRNDRINFLKSVIHNEDVEKYIPEKYNEILDFIWMDVIKNVIKKLEKMEDELKSYNMNEFSISGHTEGKRYLPWQMFDKSRYVRSNHE